MLLNRYCILLGPTMCFLLAGFIWWRKKCRVIQTCFDGVETTEAAAR